MSQSTKEVPEKGWRMAFEIESGTLPIFKDQKNTATSPAQRIP
jgi:hypothetical protein